MNTVNEQPAARRAAATPAIVFEDDDVLVVDKPGGLVCHSASRPEHTSLAELLREHGVETPRLVNRLDRETSGLVIVAKNERAGKMLGKQVLRREIEKEYIAICWGVIGPDTGVIDQPIAVTGNGLVYTRRSVDPSGKASVTEFEVLERLGKTGTAKRRQAAALQNGFTVVQLKPRTGRAHQLRVHMAWLGHPIVGDKIYGPNERLYLEFIEKGVTDEMLGELLMSRQALHANAVTIRHPSTQLPVTCRAELPDDMREFIEERR